MVSWGLWDPQIASGGVGGDADQHKFATNCIYSKLTHTLPIRLVSGNLLTPWGLWDSNTALTFTFMPPMSCRGALGQNMIDWTSKDPQGPNISPRGIKVNVKAVLASHRPHRANRLPLTSRMDVYVCSKVPSRSQDGGPESEGSPIDHVLRLEPSNTSRGA